jgi:polyhydroxyalkanoate synthesis regulator phasin
MRYKNIFWRNIKMTTTTEQNTPDEPVKRTVFYELSRKVMLAAIGAAAVASDEITSFVTRLAERGEIAEKDARRLITEVLDQREKLEEEQKTEQEHAKAAVNKAEIEALTTRINELNKRIEELKKGQQPTGQES